MALTRCSECGNLVSDKASACPICGHEVSAAAATTAPASTPKTLNDILAERGAVPETLNDRLQREAAASTAPAAEADATAAPRRTQEPTAERHAPAQQVPAQQTETSATAAASASPRTASRAAEPILPDPRAADSRYAQDAGTPAEEPWRRDDDDDESYDDERRRRAAMGYRIALIILVLIIIPLAFFFAKYVSKVRDVERNAELVASAKQMLEEENSQLEADAKDLVAEFENMKIQNDTMLVKYQQATAMLEQLQKEKTYNYNQINKYKRELATLKDVMKGYLRQIDSLNSINRHLQQENISFKKDIATAQLRADVAEEKAEELNTKVRIGSVIRARSIALASLGAKSNPVSRIKNAKRLRVDFELTANELAEPGQKTVYVRILSPEGYLLSGDNVITFSFEGEALIASAERTVDYENNDVPVSIFYTGNGFTQGTYTVQLYTEGRLIGENEIYMR